MQGAFLGMAPFSIHGPTPVQVDQEPPGIVVERAQGGRPHEGKVRAAIQPHSDDIPLFTGGTVAKLIKEGSIGYLIRTTNDDHAGRGATIGEVLQNNEQDNEAVANALGLKKVYNFNYT